MWLLPHPCLPYCMVHSHTYLGKKSLEQVSFPHVLIAYGPAPYAERDCIHIAPLLHFNSRFVNPKVLSA
jgi:hypothetical protein